MQATFDQLPKAVHQLGERLDSIEQILTTLTNTPTGSTTPPNEFLNAPQAAELLGIAQQTLYQNIRKLPHKKRFGKLFFKRSDLMEYLEAGTTLNKKGGKQC
jgi:predicted DNA-binding transcriptional regulator AlpA